MAMEMRTPGRMPFDEEGDGEERATLTSDFGF
jgi:hypothetical protein